MSQNSPFFVDKYSVSRGSPFSVEEYCVGLTSPLTPSNIEPSQEFSIEEYDNNDDRDCEGKSNQMSKDIETQAHTDILFYNAIINVYVQENQLSSPMQIRRVPRRIHRMRFDLVTLDKQLGLDVKNHVVLVVACL